MSRVIDVAASPSAARRIARSAHTNGGVHRKAHRSSPWLPVHARSPAGNGPLHAGSVGS